MKSQKMASLAKQPVNCIRGGRNELDATIHSFRHVLFLERTQSGISKAITVLLSSSRLFGRPTTGFTNGAKKICSIAVSSVPFPSRAFTQAFSNTAIVFLFPSCRRRIRRVRRQGHCGRMMPLDDSVKNVAKHQAA
ncbi:hypothetical protein PPTG_22824 [Phytophthora nicotianae INRA-310]|uniref:Uncharacterized protein n=1 Tax=Phytophthora nicotianae (strain INRA-310) TaxID=761204 RepID=W2QB04_PHYN3|nr:hypothetical protein PPTG_22824 [Phytophthora nicotianae INRA-310]ETN09739.1 hypothetical protein PPTG_22824 [Phytophthora nicotianae INRA-310]